MIPFVAAISAAERDESVSLPTPGVYRHFKGGKYVLVEVAKHSETEELVVIYKPLDDEQLWVRPLDMFVEPVVWHDREVPRFTRLASDEQRRIFGRPLSSLKLIRMLKRQRASKSLRKSGGHRRMPAEPSDGSLA
jgi:hypothetical protein